MTIGERNEEKKKFEFFEQRPFLRSCRANQRSVMQ